jgi:hypothetical protein
MLHLWSEAYQTCVTSFLTLQMLASVFDHRQRHPSYYNFATCTQVPERLTVKWHASRTLEERVLGRLLPPGGVSHQLFSVAMRHVGIALGLDARGELRVVVSQANVTGIRWIARGLTG